MIVYRLSCTPRQGMPKCWFAEKIVNM